MFNARPEPVVDAKFEVQSLRIQRELEVEQEAEQQAVLTVAQKLGSERNAADCKARLKANKTEHGHSAHLF